MARPERQPQRSREGLAAWDKTIRENRGIAADPKARTTRATREGMTGVVAVRTIAPTVKTIIRAAATTVVTTAMRGATPGV